MARYRVITGAYSLFAGSNKGHVLRMRSSATSASVSALSSALNLARFCRRDLSCAQSLRRSLHFSPGVSATTKAESPSSKSAAKPLSSTGGSAASTRGSAAAASGAGGVASSSSVLPPIKYDFFKPVEAPHQRVYAPSPPVKGGASGSPWTTCARRVGALALKCGMTADWDKYGVRRALTVMKVRA